MPISTAEVLAGRALWQAICAPETPPISCDETLLGEGVRRFARKTAPTVAAWLIPALTAQDPKRFSADKLERMRQYNRFTRARAREWLELINAAGIDVLALKGLATATRFYPDPLIRAMGDVDLLVRPKDVGRLCDLLAGQGFRFKKSRNTPIWGFPSESSFHPFVSADGSFVFDIHIAADDYPVSIGLPVDRVFDAAQTLDVDGVKICVPSDDHLLLLALTHAGRDKFGPDSLRSLTDIIVALTRANLRPGWPAWGALIDCARAGGFLRPMRAAINLLAALGVGRHLLPEDLLGSYPWPAQAAFAGVVRDCLTVFVAAPSRTAMQIRDWLLISSSGVLAHRNGRRRHGLVRPWSGVPVIRPRFSIRVKKARTSASIVSGAVSGKASVMTPVTSPALMASASTFQIARPKALRWKMS
jgi:hypothetical protein